MSTEREALRQQMLLRALLVEWWECFGATPLGGTCKLMISEAGNFPEVARYHHDAVIVRWMALLGRAYAIGVERGVFRDMDVETVRQLVFFPLLMQAVWKNSMSCCDETRSLPDSYFPTYFEMIFRGLRAAPVQESRP